MAQDLKTENRLPSDQWIDRLSIEESLSVMLDNQAEAVIAVRSALPQILQAVEAIYQHLCADSCARLIYCGAGTSARIAVQDGAELLPTFDWPTDRIGYMIAGGMGSVISATEGAEDSIQDAEADISALGIGKKDILIILSASGETPYSVAATSHANNLGALTIGIANNPDTSLLTEAQIPILLDSGAEAVAGSTRLKAGTAQKICLNLLSTQIMTMFGRVQNGLMSAMQPRNEKLRKRRDDINAQLQNER